MNFASSSSSCNLNVMMYVVGVGVVCVMFFVLFKSFFSIRGKVRDDIAALSREIEALKALITKPDDDIKEETDVCSVETCHVVLPPPPSPLIDDLFEVVSITSNEIKDMLGSVVENIADEEVEVEVEVEIQADDEPPKEEEEVLSVAYDPPSPSPSPSPSPPPSPPPADVKNMKLEDLRKQASSLGLDAKGTKTQLIERISAHANI